MDLVENGIPLEPGTAPIQQLPRRLGHEKDDELEEHIQNLARQGLVEPTSGA